MATDSDQGKPLDFHGYPITAECVGIIVTGDCGHELGVFINSISEKYPFWCMTCDQDKRMGKYPWTLTTQILRPQPAGEDQARQ